MNDHRSRQKRDLLKLFKVHVRARAARAAPQRSYPIGTPSSIRKVEPVRNKQVQIERPWILTSRRLPPMAWNETRQALGHWYLYFMSRVS